MRNSFWIGMAIGIVATIFLCWLINGLARQFPWVDVLLLFACSGMFGGIVAALQVTDVHKLLTSTDASHWNLIRFWNAALALLISAIGGIGGSSAALLVLAWDKKIPIPASDVDRLAYVGLGVASGFLGFKLLGKIAEQVGGWLQIKKELDENKAEVKQEVAEKTAEVKQEVAEKTAEVKQEVAEKTAAAKQEMVEKTAAERRRTDNLLSAITKGLSAQRSTDLTLVADAIEELTRALAESPDNRTAAMILGWLYANKVPLRLQMALDVLTATLEGMRQRGSETPENRADLLYNCACYHYRLAQQAAEPEKARLKDLMYRELEESVRIKPSNKKVAREDTTDFAEVKSEQQFQDLTRE